MIERQLNEPPLSKWQIALACVVAAIGYWITFSYRDGGGCILVALPALFLLHRVATVRQAFYIGLVCGVAMYAPPLAFFARVFGLAAIALYLIAGLPIAAFVVLAHIAHRRFSPTILILLMPVFWTGIEYFRSELYALRFAWLLPGQAFAFAPGASILRVGVYGVGFLCAGSAALMVNQVRRARWIGAAATVALALVMYWPQRQLVIEDGSLHVAGVQLEFPTNERAAGELYRVAVMHPEAQILVLSEYSFDGRVPQVVRDVVRKHGRYLVAGGTHSLNNGDYYDVAYVIDPQGKDIFDQGKSVPVQLMSDGLPATRRQVWDSPWGKIGIAICYDLSYSRVMDDFVSEGAQGLIIPTEDAKAWGLYERTMLHGRMAPVRSAEYGIPTFGVWSSGVSQLTDRWGQIIASGGYPGQGDVISGPFVLKQTGHVPADRWAAQGAVAVTTAAFVYFVACAAFGGRSRSATREN